MQYFLNRMLGLVLLLGLVSAPVMAEPMQRGGIVLSFDDWFVDQWHEFFTDLKATNPEIEPHSTFFVSHWLSDLKGVNQNRVGNDSHYVKLKQLEDAGHEIAAHGINHIGAGDAPYNLACDKAAQYVTDEVQPGITAMAQGDPGLAGDYGFIPKSFSDPFGDRSAFYDNAIKTNTGVRYLRGTLPTDFAIPLKDTNAIYHKRTGGTYPYLVGDGLDMIYQNDVPEVKAALDRASTNDEVITLYAHRILPLGETSNYGIAASKLKEIILYAHSKGLKFYRFSDAFAEAPETTGTCGGGGGTGSADSISFSYADDKGNNTYRVGLQWTNLPHDVMHIALASQPATALASANTGGAANGKVAMNIPNVVAGTEYVAVAKSGSTTVATSNPFIILAGNPPPPVVVAAPTNLVANAVSSTQVNLSWADNSNNETRFVVGRCNGSSCDNFAELSTVNANLTTYTDSSVQPSSSYRYRVLAYSGTTVATSYPVASVTTPAGPPITPNENLAFSYADAKGNNTYRVGLQWTNLPNDEIHIALASQPASALTIASTSGAASGKIGLNVPNVVAGAEYVAVAKSGSTTVATSATFIILVGNATP